eukprot:4738434-Alexandrium_andersonii.AAC.1
MCPAGDRGSHGAASTCQVSPAGPRPRVSSARALRATPPFRCPTWCGWRSVAMRLWSATSTTPSGWGKSR